MAKTKYQSGSVELVWRSQIREHPLNPRTISESARKKLRASVKEIGVMDTPVFNKQTGNLVLNNQNLQGSWDAELLAELGKQISFEEMGFERVDLEFIMDGVEGIEALFDDAAPVKETKDALETIKADRKAMQQDKAKTQSADFYVTVVCRDQEEKERLCKHLGVPKGETYIASAEVFALKRA